MTIRSVAYTALVFASGLAIAAACGSPTNVRAGEDACKIERGKAKELGAKDCAREEFARSQAQMEFAKIEIEQGDYSRAEDHLTEGFRMAKAAQRGAKNCDRAI